MTSTDNTQEPDVEEIIDSLAMDVELVRQTINDGKRTPAEGFAVIADLKSQAKQALNQLILKARIKEAEACLKSIRHKADPSYPTTGDCVCNYPIEDRIAQLNSNLNELVGVEMSKKLSDYEATYSCRFHPTESWHEVGCSHQKWSVEELQEALDCAKQSIAFLADNKPAPTQPHKDTKLEKEK